METYSVEQYISFASKRIEITCQHEAQRLKLDFEVVKRESISQARDKKDTYDDKYGTSGFMKWFSVTVHSVCTFLLNNPKIYQHLLAERTLTIKEVKIPEVIIPEVKTSKVCSMCGKDKDFKEFYNNRAMPDGKSSACKPCLNDRAKELDDLKKNKTIKTTALKQSKLTTTSTVSDVAFTNEDIDELIIPIKDKLDAAQAEVERLKALIDKLQRRKK